MQRFSNILFVHDPSVDFAAALDRAVRLARNNSARLMLVSVVEELPRSLPNVEKNFLELHEKQLRGLVSKSAGRGIEIATRILVGTPFLQIIRQVMRGRHDLVIKAAKGRGGASGYLFGSTDLHLMRKCPCPVWIIKPSKRKQYARILAAVDPYHEEEDGADLNTLILDLATSLAEQEGSELHIVHAWNLSYESFLRSGRARVPKSQVEREVREARKVHKKRMDELVGRYDLGQLNTRVHFPKGQPGDVIPSVARRKRVELVVMGTLARTGVAGLIIGNTAEKILGKVDCSVLAVKPKSFSTPVKA